MKHRDIINDIYKEYGQMTVEFGVPELKKIIQDIDDWIRTNNNLEKRLQTQYRNINRTVNTIFKESNISMETSISSSSLFQNYYNEKTHTRGIIDKEDLAEHYKKGYTLIHLIREVFTKQEITYTILMSDDKNGEKNIYEVSLPLEKILSAITNTSTGQIILNGEKHMLTTYNKLKLSRQKLTKSINNSSVDKQYLSESQTSLWKDLMERYYDSKYFNRGRIYELYNIIQKDRGRRYRTIKHVGKGPLKNTIPLIDKIKSNMKIDNIQGWKKGDYGLDQLKAVITSDADIISSGAIIEILEKLKEALTLDDPKEIAEALIKILTVQNQALDLEIDKQVNDIAIQNIKDTLSGIYNVKFDIY